MSPDQLVLLANRKKRTLAAVEVISKLISVWTLTQVSSRSVNTGNVISVTAMNPSLTFVYICRSNIIFRFIFLLILYSYNILFWLRAVG